MQRSSVSTLRNIIIVCLLALVFVTFLYLTKRIETNKLSRKLQAAHLDRRNAEEDLTSKLTEHLEKIESLTQEVGLLQGKLTRCEDEKATTMLDTKNNKQRADDCETEKQQLGKEKRDLEANCNKLKEDRDRATSQMASMQHDNAQIQASLTDAENELEECEEENAQCQTGMDSASRQITNCKQEKDACTSQLISLQSQIKHLPPSDPHQQPGRNENPTQVDNENHTEDTGNVQEEGQENDQNANEVDTKKPEDGVHNLETDDKAAETQFDFDEEEQEEKNEGGGYNGEANDHYRL